MRLVLIAPLALALALAILLGSQLIVPGIAERQVADRLTAGGGTAEVSVSAFPALRLLFEDGSRLDVEARGLDIDIDGGANLERLDGFGRVEVAIRDSRAGPFALESFDLTRDRPAPYRLRSRGRASPAEVVDYGADRFGIPGGGLLGAIAGQALGRAPVPFSLDMELVSDDGRIEVVSGGGSVAGIPAGPFAELIVAAVVARL